MAKSRRGGRRANRLRRAQPRLGELHQDRGLVALLLLEHERGVEVVENLARGASTTMRFKAGGETSYRLRVRFADGSELAGGGGYAEAGYEFSETVGDSAIKTDTRLPAGY